MNLKDITKPEPITSVAELIDLHEFLLFLLPVAPHLPLPPPPAAPMRRWSFRGQACDFGTLAPSFQRQFPRQSFGAAEVIELRLIDAFRKHYETLGDRNSYMPGPERISSGYDLRCLSVMQHYEIPTRLLDWTSSYWTAVYFACASDPGKSAELWYYDRSIFDAQLGKHGDFNSLLDRSWTPPPEPAILKRRGEGLLVELDPQLTPRMQQQHAHHTVSTDVFADHAPLLFELQKAAPFANGSEPLFQRVIIDGACKSKALQFLADEMKITASTIFPDVVGLGRFLRWQFESLRTMLL